MKKTEKYEEKNILVLGLARSGKNAALLLHQLGAKVTVNDAKDLSDDPDAQELEELGINVVSGGHPENLLDEKIDFLIKNPGIRYDNPIIEKALAQKIPILTDVELAYEVCEGTLVAITGTNGKTTTTMMLTEVMNTDRKKGKAFAAGNIGFPASEVVQKVTSEDELIMEMSSFQLMGTQHFRPSIAVFTNIYSAHLDYHSSREEYVQAKMNITKNQKETDWFIYNWDLPELRKLSEESPAQLVPFSRHERMENGVYVLDGTIYFRNEPVMEREDVALPGEHNLENALAAIAAAKLLGKTNKQIQDCLSRFSGVKHRMQFVLEHENRKVYNDSKATNTLATIQALQGFNQPIVLLAGGLDRGQTFEDLVPVLKEHVKAMIVFGETASTLIKAGEKAGVKTIRKVADVTASVPEAFEVSESGDVILFSPACASWDQYDSFEKRGDAFIESVNKLVHKPQ